MQSQWCPPCRKQGRLDAPELRFFHSYCLPLVFWHLWFRAMASNTAFLFVSEALSLLYYRPGGGERNRENYQEWVCCEMWLCVFCLCPLVLANLTVLKAAPPATRGRHPSSVFLGSCTLIPNKCLQFTKDPFQAFSENAQG